VDPDKEYQGSDKHLLGSNTSIIPLIKVYHRFLGIFCQLKT